MDKNLTTTKKILTLSSGTKDPFNDRFCPVHSDQIQWTTGEPIPAEVVSRISKLDPIFPQVNQKKCLCAFNLKAKNKMMLTDYIRKYIATVLKDPNALIFYRNLTAFRVWLVSDEGVSPANLKKMLSGINYKNWMNYLKDELQVYRFKRLGLQGIKIREGARALKETKKTDQKEFVPINVKVDSPQREPAMTYENGK